MHGHGDHGLRPLVAQLSWPARGALPSLAYDASDLQQQVPDLRASHLSRANNVLHAAKALATASYLIRAVAPDITPENARSELARVHDFSCAQQLKGGSRQGFALLLGGHVFLAKGGPASMVEWG